MAEVAGLRPTGDRIRETVFNWLQADIRGAAVLDLFSGTGALGLEALSRGAGYAWLVELNARAAAGIAATIDLLKADNAHLKRCDAIKLLEHSPPSAFDIVFLDPPFDKALWDASMQRLLANHWLASQALVYLEYPAGDIPALPQPLHWYRQATAGNVGFGLASVAGPDKAN